LKAGNGGSWEAESEERILIEKIYLIMNLDVLKD